MFLPNKVSEDGSILHDTPQNLLVQGVALTTRCQDFSEKKSEGAKTFSSEEKEGGRTFSPKKKPEGQGIFDEKKKGVDFSAEKKDWSKNEI